MLLPEGVSDVAAWEQFCQLVASGAGVCDHPSRPNYRGPASAPFFRMELLRVEHHRRNCIPFLTEHCGLVGQRVMEFGAGTGGLSVAMVRAGINSVDAVEPVKANLNAGLWRTRAYGLGGAIRFHHVTDTRRLPFCDGSFDAVVCSSVLQYVPSPTQRRVLLREMARVIRPQGLLVVCATGNGIYPAGPHSSKWWSNLLPELAAQLGHNRGVTYWELHEALALLGFRVFPQGGAALERWHSRRTITSETRLLRVAHSSIMAAFGIVAASIATIMKVPTEAFLPFPELVFRKLACCSPNRHSESF